MVHTRFSSVSHFPSERGSASKAIVKLTPKKIEMKNSKLKGKGKRLNLTIQDNIIPPPKGMQYVIPIKEHKTAKINTNSKYEQITDLLDTLSVKQLDDFRASCFGHFTRLRPFKIQYQVIHNLLLRQLKQPNPLEIWIGVAGTKLHFGLREFALITGLRCVGAVDKKRYFRSKNDFLNTYYQGANSITKSCVKQTFLQKKWKTDEDAIKIANLYFLHHFLLSSSSDSVISKGDLDILDSGDFDRFPWGKEIYKTTIKSLKSNARTSSKDNYYRLNGFPYAFQLWFYECCPYLYGKYCDANSGCIPRVLSWSNDCNAKFEDVYTTLSLNANELELRNLTPTASEIEELNLDELFPKSKQPNFHDNDNSDDDFVTRPPPLLKGTSSHSTAREGNMSLMEMQRKLIRFENCQNNLTLEVNSLKTTITEMRSYFESVFSNLQETIMKEVRRQNENTDDAFIVDYIGDDFSNPKVDAFRGASPSRKDAEILEDDYRNTRGWDPWPQSVLESSTHILEEGWQSWEHSIPQPLSNNITSDANKFKELTAGVANVAVEVADVVVEVAAVVEEVAAATEDVSLKVADVAVEVAAVAKDVPAKVAADVAVEVAAADGDVAVDCVKIAEKDTNVVLGDSKVAEPDTDATFFYQLSDKELADLELAVQSASKIENPKLGTSSEPIEATPVIPKRIVKLPLYLQSPFLQHFGSASGKSTDSLAVKEVFKTVKGLSALDDKIGELPGFEISGDFIEWLDNGMVTKKNTTTFYSKKDNEINPVLNLGVDLVSQKTWFHILEYGSKNLTNSHVDVFFYHLRKKLKNNFSITSTNSTFQTRVATMFDACVKKNNFTVNVKQEIARVIMGDVIRYSVHWSLVGNILFPIWIREQKHWLLGRLSLSYREVHVYNTLKCYGVKEILVKSLCPFCKLLPYYLRVTGFYDRTYIDFSSESYLNKSDTDPLGLILHHDCVKSSSIDSGIYMVSFAEYFAAKKEIPRSQLDLDAHRSRLAFLFYSYGMAKQIYGYENETEDTAGNEKTIKTPTKKRKTRSMK